MAHLVHPRFQFPQLPSMLSPLTREHIIDPRFPHLEDPDLLESMHCLQPHAVPEARQLRGEILVHTQLPCQLSLLLGDSLLQGTGVVGQARNFGQKTVRSDEGAAICIYAHAQALQCQHAEVCRRRFDPVALVIPKPEAQCRTDSDRCGGRMEETQERDGGDVRPVLLAVRFRAAVSHIPRACRHRERRPTRRRAAPSSTAPF